MEIFLTVNNTISKLSIFDIVQLVVSLATLGSLYIAIKSLKSNEKALKATQQSIELSKSEGNIFENPNYSISYDEIISCCECRNQEEFDAKVLSRLSENINTKEVNLDTMINVMDYLLFIPYTDPKTNKEKIDECIENLENILKKSNTDSSSVKVGTQFIIVETYKLILYIFRYHNRSNNYGNNNVNVKESISDILKIRGNMLGNSITKLLFYNYLGLYYINEARKLIKTEYQCSENVFYELANAFSGKKIDKDKEAELKFYLDKSKDMIESGRKIAKDDVYWETYLKYNLARCFLLEYLVFKNNNSKNTWEEMILDTIRIRSGLVHTFNINRDSKRKKLLKLKKFEQEHNTAKVLRIKNGSILNRDTKKKDSILLKKFEQERDAAKTLYWLYYKMEHGNLPRDINKEEVIQMQKKYHDHEIGTKFCYRILDNLK